MPTREELIDAMKAIKAYPESEEEIKARLVQAILEDIDEVIPCPT